jgi:hypothetical protein
MVAEATKERQTEAKPAAEKQTNCLACNKLIKKLKRYYRDGKFYCSKKCWRAFIDKSKPQGDGLASK